MKKVILLFILLMPTFLLFSDSTQEYEVRSFTGSVRYQDHSGSWKRLEEGMVLEADSVVNVGLNSQLILVCDDQEFKLSAMKRGSLEELLDTNTGLRLGNRIQNDDVDVDDIQNRSDISTASTRADDADDELEWVEEE